jgi:flagellar hook-length control protein FliK
MLDISAALQDVPPSTTCPVESKSEVAVGCQPQAFAGILAAQQAAQSAGAPPACSGQVATQTDPACFAFALGESKDEDPALGGGDGNGAQTQTRASARDHGENKSENSSKLTNDAGSAQVVALPIAQDWLPSSHSLQAMWGNFTEPASTISETKTIGEAVPVTPAAGAPIEPEKQNDSPRAAKFAAGPTITREFVPGDRAVQANLTVPLGAQAGGDIPAAQTSKISGDGEAAAQNAPALKLTADKTPPGQDSASSTGEEPGLSERTVSRDNSQNPGQSQAAVSSSGNSIETADREETDNTSVTPVEGERIGSLAPPTAKESKAPAFTGRVYPQSPVASEAAQGQRDENEATSPITSQPIKSQTSETIAKNEGETLTTTKSNIPLGFSSPAGEEKTDASQVASNQKPAAGESRVNQPIAESVIAADNSMKTNRDNTSVQSGAEKNVRSEPAAAENITENKTSWTYRVGSPKDVISPVTQDQLPANDTSQATADKSAEPMLSAGEKNSTVAEIAARQSPSRRESQADKPDSLAPRGAGKIQTEITGEDSGESAGIVVAPAQKAPGAKETADKVPSPAKPVGTISQDQSKVSAKVEKTVSFGVGEQSKADTSQFGEVAKLADNRQNAEVSVALSGKEKTGGAEVQGSREVKASAAAAAPVQSAATNLASSPPTAESLGSEQTSESADFALAPKPQVKEAAAKLEGKASESARADTSLSLAAAGVEGKENASKLSPGREQSAGEVRIIEQIAEKAVVALSGGRKEVQIQLDPPLLGKVELKVTAEGGIITAHLQASAPAARDLLQQNIETLKAALEKADLGIGQCTVSLGSEQHSGGEAREDQLAGLISEKSFGSFTRPLSSGGGVARTSGWSRGVLDYFA